MNSWESQKDTQYHAGWGVCTYVGNIKTKSFLNPEVLSTEVQRERKHRSEWISIKTRTWGASQAIHREIARQKPHPFVEPSTHITRYVKGSTVQLSLILLCVPSFCFTDKLCFLQIEGLWQASLSVPLFQQHVPTSCPWHILVILSAFPNFSWLLYLLWWSVISFLRHCLLL